MPLKQNYLGLLILGSIAATQPAFAIVDFGSSSGYGVAVVTPPIPPQAPLIPASFVSNSAPAPYDTSGLDVAHLDYISGSLVMTVFSSQAQVRSDVDGLPGVRTTTGFGEANGISVILGSDASGTLSLIGTTFGSGALVTGEYGSLTPSGVSSIDGLSLVFDTALVGDANDVYTFGLFTGALNVNLLVPDPTILSALGTFGVTSIILNEQSGSCNGIDFCEIGVNALHIYGANEVIFGHSYAKQTAIPVPEASTYGMMLAGLGLVGAMVARRHKPIPAVALT